MELRGAVVEDLQLPPPLPIYSDMPLVDARELVFDRWPLAPRVVGVLDRRTQRLVAYLEGLQLESDLADDPSQVVARHMRPLVAPAQVTLDTPVAALIAALKTAPIAEVTDREHKYVLATVTQSDLERRHIGALCQY